MFMVFIGNANGFLGILLLYDFTFVVLIQLLKRKNKIKLKKKKVKAKGSGKEVTGDDPVHIMTLEWAFKDIYFDFCF